MTKRSERKFVRRGEIWLARLSPVVGHEQDGTRPCLVISSDSFNSGWDALAAIVPLTTKQKSSRNAIDQIPIEPKDSGLNYPSFILCDHLRVISHDRLIHRMKQVPESFLKDVAFHIGMMLELPVEEPDFTDD